MLVVYFNGILHWDDDIAVILAFISHARCVP